MNPQILGTLTIPGSELSNISDRVAAAFGISKGDAADFVSKVLDAYGDAVQAVGSPYIKGSAAGSKIAYAIQANTGVSLGRIVQTLNEMAYLVGIGKISLSTYNPLKYSISAKVKSAAKSALKSAKSAAQEVVPDSLQKTTSGVLSGLEGLGDLASMLPLILLGVGGWWLYNNSPKGRRA